MRGSMSKTFYVTTTLPYVNSSPHIGFALEIVEADVIARYHREILNEQVIFNTGTDEHGQKIADQAKAKGLDPQDYCDHFAQQFQNLKNELNLSNTHLSAPPILNIVLLLKNFGDVAEQMAIFIKLIIQLNIVLAVN
jgi:methionyl-tRNA synthetase